VKTAPIPSKASLKQRDIKHRRLTRSAFSFINRVSNAVQLDEPPQFYGGIISDPMGLGKTLSMIGLIAYDIIIDRSIPSTLTGVSAVSSSDHTLVVVPPPCKLKCYSIAKYSVLTFSQCSSIGRGNSKSEIPCLYPIQTANDDSDILSLEVCHGRFTMESPASRPLSSSRLS
jgi:hypothetical protein